MNNISVSQALESRRSIREFTAQSVSATTLSKLLSQAAKSASGSNLQPWQVYALTGSIKDQLCQTVTERLMSNPAGEKADIPIYPKGLTAPWKQRRSDCGEVMYEALGISREDKMGRLQQSLKNFSFFGAPVGLIFTLDRHLIESQVLDTGILVQSIMLLAKQYGLDTCPQACWSMWPETIREVLDIPENERVLMGMSLGYANPDSPVNHIQQPRLDVQSFVSLRGFDAQR